MKTERERFFCMAPSPFIQPMPDLLHSGCDAEANSVGEKSFRERSPNTNREAAGRQQHSRSNPIRHRAR
jgi:hypothetical protein